MTGAAPRNCKHGVFGVAVVLAAARFAGHPDRGDSAARTRAGLPASIQAIPYETR
jgi:hypothetical protein